MLLSVIVACILYSQDQGVNRVSADFEGETSILIEKAVVPEC